MPIPSTTTKAEQDEELRRIGINGDDGDDGDNIDSKRSNARKPRSFAEIDTAAIYAKFNNPPKAKAADADND